MLKVLLNYKYELILSLFILLYIFVFSWMSINRYLSFGSYYYDLGIMNQVAHNTSKGYYLEMTNQDFGKNMSRFAIHFDPIIGVFAPLYWFWDGPEVLLIGQTIILAFGALAVYLLAFHILSREKWEERREKLDKEVVNKKDKISPPTAKIQPHTSNLTHQKIYALMFAISYLLYFPVHWQNMFDFHGVALATTFFLFAIYFAQVQKFRWSYLFIVLALLTKEHVGLVVFMYGMYWSFVKKHAKYGISMSLIGLFFFILTVFFIIPEARGEESFFMRYFTDVGVGSDGVLSGLVKNPALIFNYLADPSRNSYIIRLISSYWVFMCLAPLPFLIAAPEILINLLSSNSNLRAIFHYNALTIPFIFYSAILGFKKLQQLLSTKRQIFFLIVAVFVIFALRASYQYSVLPTYYVKNPYYKIRTIQVSKLAKVKEWQNTLKDSTIPVASSPQLAPFFTARRHYYNFLYDTEFSEQGLTQNDIIGAIGKYELAQYVIIADSEFPEENILANQFLSHLKNNKRYTLIEDMYGIKVFHRKTL